MTELDDRPSADAPESPSPLLLLTAASERWSAPTSAARGAQTPPPALTTAIWPILKRCVSERLASSSGSRRGANLSAKRTRDIADLAKASMSDIDCSRCGS